MASGDLAVEKELARHREYRTLTRTELEGESRRDLQLLAKQYYIPANIKSNKIIDEILRVECGNGTPRCDDDSDAPYLLTCIETWEAVRSLMKRISEKSSIERAASCIFDCVVKVEAEMRACAVRRATKVPTCAIKPAAIDLKVPPTVSSGATAVKAVQQVSIAPTVTVPLVSLPKASAQVPVYKYKPRTSALECAFDYGKEAMRPSNTVPAPATGALVQQVVIGVSVKTDKPVVKTDKPVVKLEPGTSEPSMACTSIFLGGIPRTMTNVQLRVKFGPKTKIKRRYHKKDKMGFACILIPNEDVDRVLKLDLSVAGHKLRVAKWGSSKGQVHRAPKVATTNRRSDQVMKEQACFLMEFLDAQAARPGERRLYSQAVAPNTSEARMKSMETTLKRILKRLSERSAG